jgi:hypothetical protein
MSSEKEVFTDLLLIGQQIRLVSGGISTNKRW